MAAVSLSWTRPALRPMSAASKRKPGRSGVGPGHDDVVRAATQGFGHQRLHQRGPVVLRAQVRGHQVPETPMNQGAGNLDRRGIGEVAVLAAHAPL